MEGSASPKVKRYVAVSNSSESSRVSRESPVPLLNFQRGDELIRFKHNERVPEWIFCKSEDGREGWVSLALIERSRSSTTLGRHSGKLVMATSSPALSRSSPDVAMRAKKRSSDLSSLKVYVKIVRVTQNWASGKLSLTRGEIVAVTQEADASFEGFTVAGEYVRFPASCVIVMRSRGDGEILGQKLSRPGGVQRKMNESSFAFLVDGKHSTPRNKVVHEIVQTELKYLKHLDEICGSYKQQMGKMPGLLAKDVPVLFQNIDAIRLLSRRMLAMFGEVLETWRSGSSLVSSVFLELGPFFLIYEEYCSGFETAQNVLDSFGRDAAVASFLKTLKGSLTLDSLLIMPVQRIPRYKLLLEDLFRRTPESHRDYAGLRDALALISTIALGVNEKVRCSEKTLALLKESRDKEKLAQFVTADRSVVSYVKGVEIKIEQVKSSGLGKLKADVYVLSDSLLLLLRKTVRSELYPWVEEFSYIFWPMKLAWVKKDTRGLLVVTGPLLCVTLVLHQQKNESVTFSEVLLSEHAKHGSLKGDLNIRKGEYSFHETGIKYDGDWKLSSSGALMDGKGMISLPSGMSYNGLFVENEITGRGKMSLPCGDTMTGVFKNGVLCGDGVVDYSNGDVFKGDFVNGVRVGFGVFRCASYEYSGEWASDNPNGKGKLRVGTSRFDGVFVEGVFVSGECRSSDGTKFCGASFVNFFLLDGVGSATYSNGSKFSGSWKGGAKEGEGKFEYSDGSVLTGNWKHDAPVGTMKWTGGKNQWLKLYEGAYVDGLPHTKQGDAVFSDGSRFKGSFKVGVIGKGELTLADGAVISGKFKGNHLAGKGSFALADGGDVFEGALDTSLRMPVYKRGFLPLQLHVSRPSFPINLAQSAVFKK